MNIVHSRSEHKISAIEITSEKLISRGGLALMLRYIDKIGVLELVEKSLGQLRLSSKGKPVGVIVRQILAAFIDGTDTTMKGFDVRHKSPESAALHETDAEEIVSGNAVRRFFAKFIGYRYALWRTILHQLFIWRLQREKPKTISLYLDTMVLDNDGALKREGCHPTYKKKKGFQPLHIHWGPYIVDVEFRSGEKHSNYHQRAVKAVAKLVRLIRTQYQADIPIVVCCDSGFLSEDNFSAFERLGIHYVGMGKLYDYLYEPLKDIDFNTLPTVQGTKTAWAYYEFGSRFKCGTNNRFRRTIFTTICQESEQTVLRGTRPDSFIHTNLGCNSELDNRLRAAGGGSLLETPAIIAKAHSNGLEELNHRSIKEFMGSEHLPFKRFGMNAAYYLLMVLAHFITEAFRQDVAQDILPQRCYPTKLRRCVIDFAAKIVRSGGKTILKVTETVFEAIHIHILWQRCNNPPLAISTC
jgi:hypothetical protein